MANYKQTDVTGSSWVRCNSINIRNYYGISPIIEFSEEEIFELGDTRISKPYTRTASLMPILHIQYDPTATVNIYNPDTLEPTGQTITHADLYGMLFSAYIDSAKKIDAVPAV